MEYAIYALYLLAGPIMTALWGVALYKGRKRMSLIHRPVAPLPPNSPRLSILIPAKDEGERIAACLHSVVAQDYPHFQVLAINDRSTDATGAVMDALAREDGRLRVRHIRAGELPEGWTGKCNALHSSVPQTEGEWLLFVDSDVILQPDAARAAMQLALDKGCDLVSFMPRLESGGFWERLLVPLCGAAVSTMYLVALTNHDHKPHIAFANGQFLLISRSAYEAMGGHAAVRGRFVEDVEIARLLKATGHKIRLVVGETFAAVRMYSSLAAIIRGWGRSFYAAGRGRPWRILLGIGYVLACCFSVYVALGWSIYRLIHPADIRGGGWGWLTAALAHLGLLTFFLGRMYRWTGNPGRCAAWFPVGGSMLLAVFVRALRICATGKIEWRGTQYQAQALVGPRRSP